MMSLDDLLTRDYPYPEHVEMIKYLADKHKEFLKNGYQRILESASFKEHQYIVPFEVWSFMACDKAYSDVLEDGSLDFIDALRVVVKNSGSQ